MFSYVYFCHEKNPQIVNYYIERHGLYYYKETIVKTIVKKIVGIHTGDFKTKHNMLTGLPTLR